MTNEYLDTILGLLKQWRKIEVDELGQFEQLNRLKGADYSSSMDFLKKTQSYRNMGR